MERITPTALHHNMAAAIRRTRMNSRGKMTDRPLTETDILRELDKLFAGEVRVIRPSSRFSGQTRIGNGQWSDDDPDPSVGATDV